MSKIHKLCSFRGVMCQDGVRRTVTLRGDSEYPRYYLRLPYKGKIVTVTGLLVRWTGTTFLPVLNILLHSGRLYPIHADGSIDEATNRSLGFIATGKNKEAILSLIEGRAREYARDYSEAKEAADKKIPKKDRPKVKIISV